MIERPMTVTITVMVMVTVTVTATVAVAVMVAVMVTMMVTVMEMEAMKVMEVNVMCDDGGKSLRPAINPVCFTCRYRVTAYLHLPYGVFRSQLTTIETLTESFLLVR